MTYWAEEEEVRTYSELVKLLEESLTDYMFREVERFRELVSTFSPPPYMSITPSPKSWRVAAVDGGSGILSFADNNIAFVAALAVIDDGRSFQRRIVRPEIIVQEDEGEGEFADRVDVERETMMLRLAQRVLEEYSPDLLIVDGPLVPRPKYTGEYILQLKTLLSMASNRRVVGFVKRPQSRYLSQASQVRLTDRALLSTFLEKFSASPWPPSTVTVEGVEVRYTFIRTLNEPESGVFRIDMPPQINDATAEEILSYIAYTADPERGPPAILMKADEEVKMSRRLVSELYRSCFTSIISKAGDPKLWAPLILRWGERLW